MQLIASWTFFWNSDLKLANSKKKKKNTTFIVGVINYCLYHKYVVFQS